MRDLEARGQIEAKIARSVEAAGDAQEAYAAARQELATVIRGRTYSFPGPLADPDVYDAVVKMAAARVRQGIESINKFILELNKMRIDAKLALLSDEELALAKKAWQEAEESAKVCTYTTKIQWGIRTIEARPYGPGFWGKRTPQSDPLVDAYELQINPNNESFYLPHPDGTNAQFENLVGNTLQDGKRVINTKSTWYRVEDMEKRGITRAREEALEQARWQLKAAQKAGLNVEWLISEPEAKAQLQRLFDKEGIPIKLTLLLPK